MTAAVPVYDDDFFSDEVINDPYPVYRHMRQQGPIIWLQQHDCYAAMSHKAVLSILRTPNIFRSGRGLSLNDDVNKLLIGSTLNSDDDRHLRQRRLTSSAITPDALVDLAPFIQNAADTLAEHLKQKKEFDAVSDFARILPVSIVIELVGLPEDGREKMLRWADATFNLFEGFNERSQQSFEQLQDLQQFLTKYGKPDQLATGGLTRRIFDHAPQHGFSVSEAAQLMRDYINPSLDTTISAASFMAYYFATHPDQWDVLRGNPDLAGKAVEEVVRLTTPIRLLSRYIAEDVDIEGHRLEAGKRILVVYASANRDETVFEEPDNFMITRKTHKHLGFGQGPHMCMGMHLARLELTSLAQAMCRHVKQWHLVGEPEISMNNTIRGLSTLPIRIDCDENTDHVTP